MNEIIYDWIDNETVLPILAYVKEYVGLVQVSYVPDIFDGKMISFVKYGILYTVTITKNSIRYSTDMVDILSGLESFIVSLYRETRIDKFL